MQKIKYIIGRIFNMDYKRMLRTVKKVHQKTNKSKIYLFFDIIYCGFKYQAGYIDYDLFEMYNLNKKERKTIITRGINNKILKQCNDMSKAYIFENKVIFNQKYKKYLNREWIFLDDNYEAFKEYIKNKKEVIIKPIDLSCGQGIEKINVKKYTTQKLYNYLIKTKRPLVEDVAVQHKIINEIYPLSVNTVRIVTLNKKVVAAFIRFGNKGNIVDNFNNEGMVTVIDIDTGIINYPAIDKKGQVYKIHPYTKKSIIGVKIPMWKNIKNLCVEACEITPEIGYIGWDVCVGKTKPFLIEGNDFPGHDLYQLPIHRDNGYGLLPKFQKVLEEKNENSNSK